ncbi:MAG: hypothetical protein LUC22_00890 [Prevotella sp.]|nr:hypothetical protein [Prevotella sp.]
MDTHDFAFYVFLLLALATGVLVVKKITGCLLRSAVFAVVLALLAYIYLHYFAR